LADWRKRKKHFGDEKNKGASALFELKKCKQTREPKFNKTDKSERQTNQEADKPRRQTNRADRQIRTSDKTRKQKVLKFHF
jgi:hypothetical protein